MNALSPTLYYLEFVRGPYDGAISTSDVPPTPQLVIRPHEVAKHLQQAMGKYVASGGLRYTLTSVNAAPGILAPSISCRYEFSGYVPCDNKWHALRSAVARLLHLT